MRNPSPTEADMTLSGDTLQYETKRASGPFFFAIFLGATLVSEIAREPGDLLG